MGLEIVASEVWLLGRYRQQRQPIMGVKQRLNRSLQDRFTVETTLFYVVIR